MLGTKLYKNGFTTAEYRAAADWCNQNHATIEDKGEYFEIVEIPPPDEADLAEAQAAELISTAMFRQTIETAPFSDNELVIIAKAGHLDEWQPGTEYKADKRLAHNGGVYVVIQDHKSQAHQPPDAEGMLAVYRPVVEGHAGTLEDPIPLTMGMNTEKDKYYSWKNIIYLAIQDANPCLWEPQTAPALFKVAK